MTANKTSIPRLHSVRFKDGSATIRVLHSDSAADRTKCERRIRDTINTHCAAGSDIAGFALVIWDKAGGSTSDAAGSDTIPVILVPDFVRNRLLAQVITRWAVEDVNNA